MDFRHLEWTQCLGICVDLCISHTITWLYHVARCYAMKNHTGHFHQKPVLSLGGGGSSRYSITGLQRKTQRISITLLQTTMTGTLSSQPRNKKLVGCSCLSLCCCSHRQTQEGQTDSAHLSGLQSWTLVRLELIVKSSSSFLCLGACQPKNRALRGAQAPRPLILLRWADTFFNFMHTREGN